MSRWSLPEGVPTRVPTSKPVCVSHTFTDLKQRRNREQRREGEHHTDSPQRKHGHALHGQAKKQEPTAPGQLLRLLPHPVPYSFTRHCATPYLSEDTDATQPSGRIAATAFTVPVWDSRDLWRRVGSRDARVAFKLSTCPANMHTQGSHQRATGTHDDGNACPMGALAAAPRSTHLNTDWSPVVSSAITLAVLLSDLDVVVAVVSMVIDKFDTCTNRVGTACGQWDMLLALQQFQHQVRQRLAIMRKVQCWPMHQTRKG